MTQISVGDVLLALVYLGINALCLMYGTAGKAGEGKDGTVISPACGDPH
jgi:hypothetical protein